MTDLRKAAEMALEALEAIMFTKNVGSAHIIAKNARYSLREALAKGGQKPTLFFGRAVYFADPKTGEKLAQPEQNSEAYGYAKRLAEAIWEKHYKKESPHWRPLHDVLGVLTQIDNMTCGLEKAQPEQEPVAPILLIENRGTPEERVIQLYTAPPNREWVGLTEKERDKIILGRQQRWEIAHMIEAKLQEKNGG